MAPTVGHYKSIRLMIRTRDHAPAHVHAVKDNREAVIEIATGKVRRCHGFSKRDVARIAAAVVTQKEKLMEAWNEIHEEK